MQRLSSELRGWAAQFLCAFQLTIRRDPRYDPTLATVLRGTGTCPKRKAQDKSEGHMGPRWKTLPEVPRNRLGALGDGCIWETDANLDYACSWVTATDRQWGSPKRTDSAERPAPEQLALVSPRATPRSHICLSGLVPPQRILAFLPTRPQLT